MVLWDDICLICGICETGPPHTLIDECCRYHFLQTVLDSLLASPLLPRDEFPEEVLRTHLETILPEADDDDDDAPPWIPFPGDDIWTDVLAIGTFADTDGEPPYTEIPAGGRAATVRRVRDNRYWDYTFHQTFDEASGEWVEQPSQTSSICARSCNFWVNRRSYQYLEAWIYWSALPPRSVAFPGDAEPMAMHGELYEIVNSQRERRVDMGGYLPIIDYYGMERTHNGQSQDDFEDAFERPWHLERALRDGLVSHDLRRALARDTGAWMASRPNVWPTRPPPSQASLPPLSPFESAELAPTVFHALPTEVLLEILGHVHPFPDLVPLTLVCRSLHRLLVDEGVLDSICRSRVLIPHAELYWLLPVPALADEAEAFREACETWAKEPLSSPGFPAFVFVREAWLHDSMRNRRRLWKISKQFEALWVTYRTEGWPNNVFRDGWSKSNRTIERV